MKYTHIDLVYAITLRSVDVACPSKRSSAAGTRVIDVKDVLLVNQDSRADHLCFLEQCCSHSPQQPLHVHAVPTEEPPLLLERHLAHGDDALAAQHRVRARLARGRLDGKLLRLGLIA